MVVGAGEDRGDSSVIEEVTKGVDRSVKGRQEEDGGVCITSDGGVIQLTGRFCASLKHKYDGQTKFIKPNSQIQYRIIKYWVSISSIHREQG